VLLLTLILAPSVALSNNLSDDFGLKMTQVASCREPVGAFETFFSAEQLAGNFEADLKIAINCAAKLMNPKLYISEYGITIGVDALSESGAYTVCNCSSQYRFSFSFPDYEEYKLNTLFLTVNGAVRSQTTILNNSLHRTSR
jgi:hypothetical protein